MDTHSKTWIAKQKGVYYGNTACPVAVCTTVEHAAHFANCLNAMVGYNPDALGECIEAFRALMVNKGDNYWDAAYERAGNALANLEAQND